MLAVKGTIQGNMVVVDDENLQLYDGKDVIITILDKPYGTKPKKVIDWGSFNVPSDRGENVDQYMEEMRTNDRI